jgi:hypothetical protein
LELPEQSGQRFAVSVSDKIRDVFDEEDPGFKKTNIVRHSRQHAIVSIAAIVKAVSDSTKSLTRRPCCEKIDFSEATAISCHLPLALFAQKIANRGNLTDVVVIINGNSVLP